MGFFKKRRRSGEEAGVDSSSEALKCPHCGEAIDIAGSSMAADDSELDSYQEELAQSTRKAEITLNDREKRLMLIDDMRQLDLTDRMSQLRTQADWEKFRLEIDGGRLLSEEEWQILYENVQERKENRQFLQNRLRLMHEQEMKSICADFDIEMARRRQELEEINNAIDKAKIDLEHYEDIQDVETLERLVDLQKRRKSKD